MNRAKGILGICLVFVCGVVVGAAGMHMLNKRTLAEIAAKGPQGLQHIVLRHLDNELSLNDKQRQQLQKIIAGHQERIISIMRPHRQEFKQNFEQTASRIRAILDPEQQKRFTELEERRKRQLQQPFEDAPEQGGLPGAESSPAKP